MNVWVLRVVTFLMFVPLIFQWTVRPFTSLGLVLTDLIGKGINLQNLFVMNTDGKGLRQLTCATIDETNLDSIWYAMRRPVLSADSSLVAFFSTNNPLYVLQLTFDNDDR